MDPPSPHQEALNIFWFKVRRNSFKQVPGQVLCPEGGGGGAGRCRAFRLGLRVQILRLLDCKKQAGLLLGGLRVGKIGNYLYLCLSSYL